MIVIVWPTVWNAAALAAAVAIAPLVAVTSALIMVSGVVALLVGGARRLSWIDAHVVPSSTPA